MNLIEFKDVSINVNDSNVYRYISKILGNEIVSISKPCYYPKLIKYFKDLQRITNIDQSKIKKFKSNISKKYSSFNIYTDNYTVMLIISILYYSQKKKYEIAKLFFNFLAIKFYSSRLHLHLSKFCSEDLWIIALNNLSPRHLFKVQKGISNSLMYMANAEYNKFKNILSNPDIDDKELVRIIYGLRTRLAQSVRSFSEMYYKLYKEKSTKKTDEDGEISGTQLIADKYSMLICVYGQIDKIALSKSIISSGLRKDLAVSMITQLTNPEYKDQLRFIMILLGRLANIKNICVEKSRNKVIRKIGSKSKIAGKYTIKDEILKLLYSLNIGYQLKTIYSAQLVNFFSNYITIFLRNRIC